MVPPMQIAAMALREMRDCQSSRPRRRKTHASPSPQAREATITLASRLADQKGRRLNRRALAGKTSQRRTDT
ncbi:MAG: hypothetical protein FJW20_14880 [Acidimicrobiia bacterium]|nr:hypothetical protein [Acidimicrobiia bacterium]